MTAPWRIEYYKSPSGQEPIVDFINELEVLTQVKVARTLELLSEFNITLGAPHSKKLSGVPFWELRILGKDNVRIFYIAKTGKYFLILHGFKKKKQKTDAREIKLALGRLSEYNARK